MAAAGSGIQELMQAELRASQIVSEARAERGQRMRQSKEDAEAEISAFRAQMETAFQAASAEQASTDDTSAAADADVQREIAELRAAFQRNEDTVIGLLCESALDVHLEVPEARKRMYVASS